MARLKTLRKTKQLDSNSRLVVYSNVINCKIQNAAVLHYSGCLAVKNVSKNGVSYLRSCEPRCEHASSLVHSQWV